jgi:hypothetical protein
MNASKSGTTPTGLREWWLSPPRHGPQLLINPWAYRNLRVFGVAHVVGGSIATAAGVICLSYGVPDWGAFFLVIAALNIAGGSWYLSIDRAGTA